MPFAVTSERKEEFLQARQESIRSGANQEKWDRDFLALAKFWAERKSLDPSTRTGAVITRGKEVVSLGYNGFPPGIMDLPERYEDRELKYRLICHCEISAIVFARQNLVGCTLFTWPFPSCSRCAATVIQAGIMRCVAPVIPPDKAERWGEEMSLSAAMFTEAGVELVLLEGC